MEQITGEAQLALIGCIVALFVSGQYLSVPSSICFITLFGVAVLNGVMMVEAINLRIESSNKEITKAIFEGAVSRLRPVLMTGTVTALGLTPMVLSNGIGSDIQRPLATVIVGGLVTAAFLTLFVLPVLYAWFSKGKLTEIRTR
jgi:cobalt-zinc-cadmium resistance protein CzcA